MRLTPLMMWSAISCAIYTSIFFPFLSQGFKNNETTETQLRLISFATIALGAGETIGVVIFGQLQDRKGYRTALYWNLGALWVAAAFLIAYA